METTPYLTRQQVKDNPKILTNVISSYTGSQDYMHHLESDRYYSGENDVISERKKIVELFHELDRMVQSDDLEFRNDTGAVECYSTFQEDVTKANHKLSHKHLYTLINQAKNYICGKSVTVKFENTSKKVQTEIDKILYTDNNFQRFGQECVKNALKYKSAWSRIAIDSLGRFRLIPVNTKEIIPMYDDYGVLVLLIRFFQKDEFDKDGYLKRIEYAEVYDDMYKDVYIKKGNYELLQADVPLLEYGLSFNTQKVVDEFGTKYHNSGNDINANNDIENSPVTDTQGSLKGVRYVIDEENSEEIKFTKKGSWGKIPFVEWKYNNDNVNQLTPIKCYIDMLDINLSDLANNVDDIQDVIWVLENYQSQNLTEFINNLKLRKAISVGENGKAHAEKVEIPVDARKELYETCEKCIYKFGRGVDFTNRDNLGNSTGVALKWSYSELDEKADELENNGIETLREVFYFVFKYLQITGVLKKSDKYEASNYKFYFDRNTIVNNKEQADISILSQQLLSRETAVSIHPNVHNVQDELKKIEEDIAKGLKQDESANSDNSNNNLTDNLHNSAGKKSSIKSGSKEKSVETASSTPRTRERNTKK